MSTDTPSTDDSLSARRRELLNRMLAERGLAPTESTTEKVPARRAPTEAPLSSAQRRLWFLQQLEPESPVYNLTCGIRIRGPVDPAALEHALTRVVHEHPILRTVYAERNGAEPVQVVKEDPGVTLRIHSVPPEENSPETWLRDVARAAAREPFPLTTDAPIRVLLLRLDHDHHVLVAIVHHIAADDQTWGVLFPDLFRHYTALTTGKTSDDAHPHNATERTIPGAGGRDDTTTYADYAVWEGGRLSGERLTRGFAHWRRVLTPPPAPLSLPQDRVRTSGADTQGADVSHIVPAPIRDALMDFGRAAGATPFMTLFAVVTALLHRITGSSDVCVGSPAVLRDNPELQRLAGNFQNTLALRVDLSGDPTFTELLARVRAVCVESYRYQEIPFERVVADLRPPRAEGRTPFFDVMFLTQEEASTGSSAPGLELSEVPLHNGTTQFDLTLAATSGGSTLELTALYRPSLFDADTVRAILDLYERLARAAVAYPDTPLSRLPLLEPAEQERHWEDGRARVSPEHRTLVQAFADTVRDYGDHPAVTSQGTSITYDELWCRADDLARTLAGGGAAPGRRVLIALPRGIELITAMVAVTRTGAAYVPVDVEHPRARLEDIVRDAAPVLAVVDSRHRSLLPETLACVLVDGDTIQGPPPADPVRAPRPDDPCYVLYTSGSTGAPKGVVVPHRSVVRLFDSTDHWFAFGPNDVWTMFHSCAFDFSTWEVWGALLRGGRLLIVPSITARSPEEFLNLVERERVTVLNQTPSAFWQLAAVDAERETDLALRWVVLGGEAVDPARLRDWYERHPDDHPRVVNMYGITETTVHVTYRPLDAYTAHHTPGSPIGTPIPDLSLRIVDAAGTPVPPLVVGEIQVGGAGVALGYLDRPDLTTERFVTSTESAGQDRLYRTGDRARRRGDGELDYLGRADAQFKVRGHRVEPAEIEAALEKHHDIAQAAATVDDNRVVAHLVPTPGTEPDPAELRAHIARMLPSHMVPAMFHLHDRLPLTASGKLDRARLGAAASGRRLIAASASPLARGTQERVASLWCELLDLPEVGADDNFFDLGGHSLLLTRVRSELSERLGRNLPIAELYAHPTARTLSSYLDTTANQDEYPESAHESPESRAAGQRASRRRAALARHRPQPVRHTLSDREDPTP